MDEVAIAPDLDLPETDEWEETRLTRLNKQLVSDREKAANVARHTAHVATTAISMLATYDETEAKKLKTWLITGVVPDLNETPRDLDNKIYAYICDNRQGVTTADCANTFGVTMYDAYRALQRLFLNDSIEKKDIHGKKEKLWLYPNA